MKLFAIVIALISRALVLHAYVPQETGKPNVIIVLTDDQGYGEVGAHGNPLIKTPNMDCLYHEGIHMENFHVNNVCSPTRAALMTGKYSTSVGVWHTLGGRNIPDIDAQTMGDIFRYNGYLTGMVGKWHLGDNFPYRPEDRGFDSVFRIGGGGLGQVADYWDNDLWDSHYWDGKKWVQTKGYCTDIQFDAAMKFIEQSDQTPFFLYLATTAPHSPIGAPPEYVDPYLEMGLSQEVAKFYGMVTNIDENLGKLRTFLSSKNLDRSTILIFMSDNGSACAKRDTTVFNAGMRGKKGSDYEGGHRVPCFIYWPEGKVKGGQGIETLTAHIDILPTLVDACELKLPPGLAMDGRSILPLLRNKKHKWPERFLVTEGKVNNRDKMYSSSCVMQNQWRLVDGQEVYDVLSDPSQKRDLKESPKKASMQKMYMDWIANVSRTFVKEYCFLFDEKYTSIPFVSMDLLPEGNAEGKKNVWNQGGVKKGETDRGVWNIAFQEPGMYYFRLCRLPDEARIDRGANSKIKELNIEAAILSIDGKEVAVSEEIKEEMAILKAKIDPGKHRISACFKDTNGNVFNAYYLYISNTIE